MLAQLAELPAGQRVRAWRAVLDLRTCGAAARWIAEN